MKCDVAYISNGDVASGCVAFALVVAVTLSLILYCLLFLRCYLIHITY